MTFGQLSYFMGILVFGGSAILLIWLKNHKQINNYKKILFYIAILALVFCCLGESLALNMNI